ncbi:MAG: GntR family transcriptional regulator [Microbacteriaceae bacterium]|nr:GntR family transcriptional regulator [Microbacteriaceae bacterium]
MTGTALPAIDPADARPPYEQLREGIAERIEAGALPVGAKLPTVRALAVELGIAPNTVARAYRELESLGLLRTAGRAGTFVAEPELGDAEREAVRRLTADYVAQLRALGVAPQRVPALVAAELGALRPESDR